MQSIGTVLLRCAPYLLIVATLVFGMWQCFPAEDDVLFEYLIDLHGPDSLNDGLLERPVSGWLWTPLARADMFWWPQVVLNAIGWLVIGGISAWLFAWVFPAHRGAAVAAGLFIISPILLELQFVIGGADGLSDTIRKRPNGMLMAFGAQTWPHQLARVMLAEQIYRAQQILLGHPYHRD